MRFTRTSAWTAGTTMACVAVVAGGWFGLVEPQRAAAAESRELTVAAVDANAQLELRIEQLRQDFADLPARQAELAAIRQALPEEPALAGLLREVTAHSTDARTNLDSVTSGSPVAVIDANAAPAAVEAVPADPAAGAEPSAQPSAEPSASAPPVDPSAVDAPAVPAAPAQPVLAAIPVTITVTGDYSATTLFLKNVQADMPRALLVDALTLTVVDSEDSEAGDIQTVVTGRVFVFVDPTEIPEVPSAPAAPAAPAAPGASVQPSTAPSDG